MAKGKQKTTFFCKECGFESPKWLGQCPGCKEWDSFVEEPVVKTAAGRSVTVTEHREPSKLSEIVTNDEVRTLTGIGELDRVLGGGIVTGSLVLVGGDPGIGKSTLLLQMCKQLAEAGKDVLYVSGEESVKQIKMRADRLGTFQKELFLLSETDLDIGRKKPEIVIIDSIQTMYREEIGSAPGSVSQVRETTSTLMRLAKSLPVSIFIVGHVTKEGVVAGPRVLEHMVDTVLYFEGDGGASYRFLRGVKNRFGSTDEIGVFEMRGNGLVEVPNPSEYMLAGKPKQAPGSIVVCSIEGTRPILIEVQALVCQTNFNMPRRTSTGTDYNRVNLLMAVILALLTSYRNQSLDDETICFGEVGLAGEVRAVNMAEQRVLEAAKLGFKRCILPKVNCRQLALTKEQTRGLELVGIESIHELLEVF